MEKDYNRLTHKAKKIPTFELIKRSHAKWNIYILWMVPFPLKKLFPFFPIPKNIPAIYNIIFSFIFPHPILFYSLVYFLPHILSIDNLICSSHPFYFFSSSPPLLLCGKSCIFPQIDKSFSSQKNYTVLFCIVLSSMNSTSILLTHEQTGT